MLATIACPACQFKLSIPEGDMGKRQVCPNCQSPFFAGKSITEPQVASSPPSGPAPTYQKTMLAGTAPPIKYNCPRCQAPLEAPSIEAGTKKPCPACGQRLQVPAAPPPPAAAPQPNLNKTMLAADDSLPAAPPIKYNCPSCKKPLESPASEAGIKKPCPACGQRLQIPAASPRPNPNKTMLASDANGPQSFGGQPGYATPTAPGTAPGAPATAAAGQIAIGSFTMSKRTLALGSVSVVLLLLVLACGGGCIVPAIINNGKTVDTAAAAAREKEIQKATADLEEKKRQMEAAEKFQKDQLQNFARLEDDLRRSQRDTLNGITDAELRAKVIAKQTEEKDKLDRERRDTEKKLQEEKARLQADLEKARNAQQTIIQQPPPVYYYPPYHWRYYYW
jgi:DNA-directed RNA polymerase subunit RPC12/RpoP